MKVTPSSVCTTYAIYLVIDQTYNATASQSFHGLFHGILLFEGPCQDFVFYVMPDLGLVYTISGV